MTQIQRYGCCRPRHSTRYGCCYSVLELDCSSDGLHAYAKQFTTRLYPQPSRAVDIQRVYVTGWLAGEKRTSPAKSCLRPLRVDTLMTAATYVPVQPIAFTAFDHCSIVALKLSK